jgi:predicted ArsR family transcriptional regulator
LNYANIDLHNSIGDVIMTNVMTTFTSRQTILVYLGQHKGASALEISRALRVTPANIRYHLSILVADGRAQVLGLRYEHGRGRPLQVYGLSEAALGDNLAGLVGALFSQVLENCTGAELDAVLQRIASSLVPVQVGQADGQLTRRLAQLIAQLNRSGYAARWEAHAAAPRIIFERCPYAAVIAKYPQLCRIDGLILQQRLGSQVEQTACLEKNARGTLFCQFVIREMRSQ